MIKIIKQILIFFLLGFVLTGCNVLGVKINSSSQGPGDGALYLSEDSGLSWQQKSLSRVVNGKAELIGSLNVRDMVIDPQDAKTVYLLTESSSLWVSYNRGDYWNNLLSLPTRIEAIAIHPKDRAIVYAVSGKEIYKTQDGGSNWTKIYADGSPTKLLTSIALSYQHPDTLYVGSSDGDVITSRDGGNTWSVAIRLAEGSALSIRSLITLPKKVGWIYAPTSTGGLYISKDSGTTWSKNDVLSSLSGTDVSGSFVVDPKTGDLYYGSLYGILMSSDAGQTWKQIPLLTKPQTILIQSIAVHPRNSAILMYGTSQGIYRTEDRGKTWKTLPLPTTRSPRVLLFDRQAPAIVYLGAGISLERN